MVASACSALVAASARPASAVAARCCAATSCCCSCAMVALAAASCWASKATWALLSASAASQSLAAGVATVPALVSLLRAGEHGRAEAGWLVEGRPACHAPGTGDGQGHASAAPPNAARSPGPRQPAGAHLSWEVSVALAALQAPRRAALEALKRLAAASCVAQVAAALSCLARLALAALHALSWAWQVAGAAAARRRVACTTGRAAAPAAAAQGARRGDVWAAAPAPVPRCKSWQHASLRTAAAPACHPSARWGGSREAHRSGAARRPRSEARWPQGGDDAWTCVPCGERLDGGGPSDQGGRGAKRSKD